MSGRHTSAPRPAGAPAAGAPAPDWVAVHRAALDAAYARGDRHALGAAARRCLALAPNEARAAAALSALLGHAARLLALLGAPEDALLCLRAARALTPQSAVLAANEVHYLLAAGRVDDAEAAAAAIASVPTPPADVPSLGALVARTNTRTLLGRAGAGADAEEAMRRVVAAVRQLAAMRALLAEVEQGLTPRAVLEPLLAHGQAVAALERLAPPWAGEPCAGRRFLARASGGLGDQIQSVRLTRRIADAGGHVTLACDPPLHALVLAAGAAHAVVDGRDAAFPPGPFDYSVALTLDPAAGRARDGTVVQRYLVPDAGAATPPILTSTAGLDTADGVRAGLVWAGNPDHPQDRARSMPLAALKRLVAATPAATWVSLQVGARAGDLRATPATRRVWDAGSGFASMLDTACVMLGLDVVVSVDSAPAHLAGALGVPVWTLLGPLADWRWGLRRGDTPLYPSMRLLRDGATGDWNAAADRVAADLAAFVPGRPQQRVAPPASSA